MLPGALLAGSASAAFLWSLDAVTHLRFEHPWLLYLLPLAGLAIVWLYRVGGKQAERGNNLIIDALHSPGAGVPVRMAPLVLATTLLTHLVGGSAGREGTAVQMGGGLASGVARWLRIPAEHHRLLLSAGVAAGFGSVFGTPLAGAIFALEVLTIGRLDYAFLLPCLFAALVGDATCSAWGIHHLAYHIGTPLTATPSGTWLGGHVDPLRLAQAAVAGVAFGLCARAFAETTHAVGATCRRLVTNVWLRPVLGGALVIGLTWALGTREYLGLGAWSPHPGDTTLQSVFLPDGADTWSWFWKLLFTAITLGCGFKGGEVTPLFFIGGALGHALAGPLGLPVDLAAGLGFIAVFAGASNTPLACTLMGIELFGADHAVLFAVACFAAYACSGHGGIYGAQRIGTRKHGAGPTGVSLDQARADTKKGAA